MKNRRVSISGYQNPNCYACSLGGCCAEMSGEHPFPKAILKLVPEKLGVERAAVQVRNMAFQPRDTVQILGVAGLQSKVLCTHHNNLLSPFDTEGTEAFKAFERMHYAAIGEFTPEPVYTVDGDLFERCMLKMVCGGLYGGHTRTDGGTELKGVEPPLEWLQILYDDRPFPVGYGLYCREPRGQEVFTVDHSIVKWSTMILQNEVQKVVHGLVLHLFGFRFSLLATGPQPRAVEAMAGQSYRPNSFIIDGSGTRVNFAWATGPGSGEVGVRFV